MSELILYSEFDYFSDSQIVLWGLNVEILTMLFNFILFSEILTILVNNKLMFYSDSILNLITIAFKSTLCFT
jgi:hypothetical protein